MKKEALAGDFDVSSALLRVYPQAARRAALIKLGVPYASAIRASITAKFDGAVGAAAAERYINEVIVPIIDARPEPAAPPLGKSKRGLFSTVARKALLIFAAALPLALLSASSFTIHKPYEDNPADPPDVKALKAEFAKDQCGLELLQFAHKNGMSVTLDKTHIKEGNYGQYSSEIGRAAVNPDMTLDEKLVFLAHELRHGAQHKILGYDEKEAKQLTPEQSWTQRRYIEADARAYSIYCTAQRMNRLHIRKPIESARASFEFTQAAKLRREIGSWGGMTLDEYREIALVPSFGILSNYNEGHLEIAAAKARRYVDLTAQAQKHIEAGNKREARKVVRQIEKAFADKMPEAEFTVHLRRFGGVSLDPAMPTSLQQPGVTERNLRRDYARASVGNDEAVRKFDQTLQNIAGQQDGVAKYVVEFNMNDTPDAPDGAPELAAAVSSQSPAPAPKP